MHVNFITRTFHAAALARNNVMLVVCGRSVRWWDDEIKEKIEQRRQLYKRMVRGQEGL